jgi:hypothetical protein
MNNQDKNIITKCGLSSLEWPQFNPGQLLDDDDMNSGVTYTRELVRLLFRSLFGCGVICGLQVQPQWACNETKWSITVTKGLALDCMGDVIELPADVNMVYGPDCQDLPHALWVTICYIKKCCRPKDVACSQDDNTQPKPTRVRSGYEIRLYDTLPTCACHCATGDDTPPKPKVDACCDDTEPRAPAVTGTTTSASDTSTVTVCDCYKPHFEGDCDCGCGCECVILGKITVSTGDNPVPTADTTMVRRIRPLLNGYIDCGSLKLVDLKRKQERERARDREAEREVEQWDERAEETERIAEARRPKAQTQERERARSGGRKRSGTVGRTSRGN